MNTLFQIDTYLFHVLNSEATLEWLNPFMVFLTSLDSWKWIWAGLWIGFMIIGGKKARSVGFWVLPLLIVTDSLCTWALKPLFARMRPFYTLYELTLLVDSQKLSLYGFPSNHAANCFALATFLSLCYPKYWVMALSFSVALLFAYSRIYVGVHYPFDVLGGAGIGALLGWTLYSLTYKKKPSLSS